MTNVFPDIDTVIAIAREAGKTIKSMQKNIKLMIKPDGSPVTRADMESNRIILRELTKLTPGIGVVSEENDESINANILQKQNCYWVVDPLDITTNYAAGGNKYSINIALIEDGQPVLGVLFFPALGLIYYHDGNGQAYKQYEQEAPEPLLVMNALGNETIAATKQGQHPAITFNQRRLREVVSFGQHRACLVAEGIATFCTEQAGFCIWDSAATHAIVSAAGGDLLTLTGEKIRYTGQTSLPAYMVGHPAVLNALMKPSSN
jgi:3'(2'), 5'-bisphosphate nucleotidase